MLVDFNTLLISPVDGKPYYTEKPIRATFVKRADGSFIYNENGMKIPETECVDITLRMVAGEALSGAFPDEKNLTVDDKRKRGKLVDKIYGKLEEPVEISIEEAALIQQCVGKMYGAMIICAVDKVLDK